MKPYTDIFKKPIDKNELSQCVRLVVQTKFINITIISRSLGMGYGKALAMVMLLQDANVVSAPDKTGTGRALLTNESSAINAALRQLKKGKK